MTTARKLIFLFLLFGAISMWIMSIHYYSNLDTGILPAKEIAQRSWYRICFVIHISGGLVAILIGAFQIVTHKITNLPMHRCVGYIYFFAVIGSSTTGLIIAPFAMGGIISQIGFSILGALWFSITVYAILEIRKRNVAVHQDFIYRSYALTFSAITQRTLLLIPLFLSVEFIPIYRLSAWLPWIINLAITEVFFVKNGFFRSDLLGQDP